MAFIAHLVIWNSVIFIFWYYYNKKSVQKDLEEKLEQEMITARENLFHLVESTLGKAEADNVRDKIIWTGMPKELLAFVMGKPHDIKESVSMGNRDETWLYGTSIYRYAGEMRYRYKFEVYVQNNMVTGWRDK